MNEEEFESIESELGLLQNAEVIKANLAEAYSLIDGMSCCIKSTAAKQ